MHVLGSQLALGVVGRRGVEQDSNALDTMEMVDTLLNFGLTPTPVITH